MRSISCGPGSGAEFDPREATLRNEGRKQARCQACPQLSAASSGPALGSDSWEVGEGLLLGEPPACLSDACVQISIFQRSSRQLLDPETTGDLGAGRWGCLGGGAC